ncbi:cell wall hydrolase [Paenibacillus jiagnxiensis]|uniref:cell wall hydrolase n=1 Tax=Paenibacillus jiagnxiensis TaxID=3228926 RepID=UPI0033A35F83
MAGACLTDRSGLSEFNGLDSVDVLARLIYSEAQGETLEGKRGVYHVVVNRKAKNLSEFGGNTTLGIATASGQFAGMNTSNARCPDTSSSAWRDSLSVAQNGGANRIGKCLWFNTNSLYRNRTRPASGGGEEYTFDGGASYRKVVEKVPIGGHTFFRVSGY